MVVSKFIPPKLDLKGKKTLELPFMANILANTWLQLNSSRIMYPFRILGAKMIFDERANYNIDHYWILSPNRSESTTGVASGTNIFSRELETGYIRGSSRVRHIETVLEVAGGNVYIILSTENRNPWAYDIDASLIIQEI